MGSRISQYSNLRKTGVILYVTYRGKREPFFKWVGPIFTSRHIIVGITEEGQGQIKIANTDELAQYKVGVIRDDIGEETLREIGFPVKQVSLFSQLAQSIEMLISEHVDFIFMSDEALHDLIKQHGFHQKFYVAYTINYRENYFAFSKDVPDELINEFQVALDKINEKHLMILKKAGMELYKEE